jgi:hypothetical protein
VFFSPINDYFLVSVNLILNHCDRDFGPIRIRDTNQFPLNRPVYDMNPWFIPSKINEMTNAIFAGEPFNLAYCPFIRGVLNLL